MGKTIIKKITSILLAVTVIFGGLTVFAGPMEAHAASSYWKKVKAEPTTIRVNTITWKKLTVKQRKAISGIAVYRGTTANNMKLLKRIRKTSFYYRDTNVKSGQTYYYCLKTYKKKSGSCKYKHKSAIKKVVTKKRSSKTKDSDFEVLMSDAEYDILDDDYIYVEAKSWGKITWSSSDPSVAKPFSKVTEWRNCSNHIQLKKPGKAIITATNYDGQKKSAVFTVLGQSITQVKDSLDYSYKLKFFSQTYTSNPNYFFLETENPSDQLWDHDWLDDEKARKDGDYVDIEVLDADGNDVSYYTINGKDYNTGHYAIALSPGGLFDDIQYSSWYRNEYNSLKGKVRGGYLGRFNPPSAGTYTIQIREYSVNGYDITTTEPKTLGTVNVLDKAQEYRAWRQQVIDECTEDSMTKPEKMQAICAYIVNVGHYPVCLTNEALDEYEQRYGESHGYAYISSVLGRDNAPAFACLCWDSYTSTYLLEDFGEMIGYPVRSLYWDYQPGTAEWASNHYYVRSVDDGSYYMACPVGKKEYDLDEIEMIEPVTYQDYWLVME